jgi:hypothetical protein
MHEDLKEKERNTKEQAPFLRQLVQQKIPKAGTLLSDNDKSVTVQAPPPHSCTRLFLVFTQIQRRHCVGLDLPYTSLHSKRNRIRQGYAGHKWHNPVASLKMLDSPSLKSSDSSESADFTAFPKVPVANRYTNYFEVNDEVNDI